MDGFVVISPNLFVVRETTVLVRDPDGMVTIINPGRLLSDTDVRELNKIGKVSVLCWLERRANERAWLEKFPSARCVEAHSVPGALLIGENSLFFPQHRRTVIASRQLVTTSWTGKLIATDSEVIKAETVVTANGMLVKGTELQVVMLTHARTLSNQLLTLLWVVIFVVDVVLIGRFVL
jgi:hypothetical protein